MSAFAAFTIVSKPATLNWLMDANTPIPREGANPTALL
jgi:hypothetical protein